MLILASAVFAYYTVWTLLMVLNPSPTQPYPTLTSPPIEANETLPTALRRRLARDPIPLPAPRLGHPHPRHPAAARRRRGGQFPQRGHGAEQSQESGQSGQGAAAAEGAVVLERKRGLGGSVLCKQERRDLGGGRFYYWGN
jgi:hypothetical protein